MQPFPDGFAKKVIDVHGEAGADWLSRLAGTIAECESRWSLRVMPPFATLSYNYIAPVFRADGTEAVLKLAVARSEFLTETEALRVYDGRGIVRLLEADYGLGAMLLEYLKPGTLLSNLTDDEQATSIAAHLMRQLWRPPPPEHPFPTVSKWASGLEKLRDPFGGADFSDGDEDGQRRATMGVARSRLGVDGGAVLVQSSELGTSRC